MGVHNLQKKPEFEKALQENDIVVVDFFATWCGPCKVIAPKIVEFSDTFKQVAFFKVDVDESPDIAQQYNISAMPTFLVFRNSKQVAEVVGASPQVLEKAIQTQIAA